MSEGNSLDVGALVQECIERVIGHGSRAEAALELHRLGVTSRGSVRTRGSVAEAAPGRFPVPATTRKLVEVLSDSDAVTRRYVIAALGEWGGTEAAGAIVSHLRSEQDEEPRLYGITALRTIGGANAVEGLCRFVEKGTETERDLALSALEELATGGGSKIQNPR